MKKLLIAITLLLSFAGAADAQKVAKKAPEAKQLEAAKPVNKTADATQQRTERPLKKDGTPDKRFKGNKLTKKDLVPLKKDGTPDLRFKENKKAQ